VVEASRAAALVEGALLAFRVKSEAWADKGPVMSLADMPASMAAPDKPGVHAAPAEDPFLRGVEIAEIVEDAKAREAVDAAIEEAGQRSCPLTGGGDIAVDATRALTAIDIDAGDRGGPQDATAFAMGLNLSAAEEAARQIALRGIGGLVVVDFLGLDQRRDQRTVVEKFRAALQARLGRASEVLEMSALGLCEVAVARRQRPVSEALAAPAEEREALDALRMIETGGAQARGAKIMARMSAVAADWLERDHIGWKAALADRIGARWTIEAASGGRPEVWSAS
jgi:Ribonuclease G/E